MRLTCQHCKHSWVSRNTPHSKAKRPNRCPKCGNNWRVGYTYRTRKASTKAERHVCYPGGYSTPPSAEDLRLGKLADAYLRATQSELVIKLKGD